MKIRILSDLHLDVNSHHCFTLKDNDAFTIIAGDTSGDPKQTIEWVNKNVKNGLLISGNHLVYNNRKVPIQDLRNELHEAFPIDGNISYLDNETGTLVKEVDGIIFIGTCLYTSMRLKSSLYNPEGDIQKNMRFSERSMNDYHWGIKDIDDSKDQYDYGHYIKLSAKDYVEWFERAISNIDKILSDNEASANPKPVVVISHHAPLKDCIGSRYVSEDNNASYCSDLEEFLEKHTSVKAWIYGHIHNDQRCIEVGRKDGSQYLVINNARGYCTYGENYNFNPNTFLDTDTWKMEVKPLSKSQQQKRKKQTQDQLANMLAWAWP